MRYTITVLLLAGVAMLAIGGQNTSPAEQQDATYLVAYHNGIDGNDPAAFTVYPGHMNTRYSTYFYATNWTDCEPRQQLSCIKVRICPPPAQYTGVCEVYAGNNPPTSPAGGVWTVNKQFEIMAGVEWHEICFCENKVFVSNNSTKLWARIGLLSGTISNVKIIRDSDGKNPAGVNNPFVGALAYSQRQHLWNCTNPVDTKVIDPGIGDLMMECKWIKQDVKVQNVLLQPAPAPKYNVGQAVTLFADLSNADPCDRGNMTVKAWFSASGVTLAPKVVDFDPAPWATTVSWSFNIPLAWKNKTGIIAYVQILTGTDEYIKTNDKAQYGPFGVNPLLDGGCTGVTIPGATAVAGTEFRPQITFKNLGQTTQNIPIKYEVWDATYSSLLGSGLYTYPNVAAGVSKTYQWPAGSGFTPELTPGTVTYNFKAYTALPGDNVPSNDAKSKTFTATTVLGDVGVNRVCSPAGTIPRGEGVDVTVVVENFGNTEATFPVKADLTVEGRTYHYSQNVENLGVGESREVTFVDRRFRQVGDWTVNSWTELPGDPNGQNNSSQQAFQVTGQEGWYVSYNVPGTLPVTKGAAMTSDGSNFFLLKGKKDGKLYSFVDDLDQPVEAGTMPQDAGLGTQIAYLDGVLYVLAANKTFGFYAVNLENGRWTQLADLPAGLSGKPAKNGGSMAVANGMIYVLKGNRTSEMYRFNPVLGTWEAMPDIPGVVKDGAALVSDGNRLFAVPGNKSLGFYTFDGSAWQRLADLPAKAKAGTVLGLLDGVVYAALGGGTSFYGYDVQMNTWNLLQEVPRSLDNKKVGSGSAMTTVDGAVLLVKKAKSLYIMAYAPESHFFGTRKGAEGVQAASNVLSAVTVANPVRNVARVSSTLPAPVSIQLYSSSGTLVRTLTSARSGAELDVAGLASGTYLLKVSSGSRTVTRQVVIQ